MRWLQVPLAILCAAGPFAAAEAAPPKASRLPTVEEYQVCRAFLASPSAEQPNDLLYEKLGIFFIYNVKHDSPEELLAFFRNRVGVRLDPQLVSHFVAVNRLPGKVDRKQFPGGTRFSSHFIQRDVYSLSRIGFNQRQDEALLYASFSSLMEDGHGSLIYLQKKGGVWSVTNAAAVWMYGASVHPFNP
jgi:hypothetical protein